MKRSGSLNELRPDDGVFKEKPGFLRRVLTGSRRKKGRRKPIIETGDTYFHFQPDPPGSPSSEISIRRGIFSRKHYGSIELLARKTNDGGEGSRFRVETGERRGRESSSYHSPSTPLLENPEYQTRWYFKYFLGKYHQNYVGLDTDRNPFVISVMLSDSNDHQIQQYRAILWRKTGTEKICLPYNPGKALTVRTILSCFSRMHKIEKGPKEISAPSVLKDLLVLEEQEGSVNFKFGVIYAKHDQTTDSEMFGNKTGSDAFNKFIAILGNRITLKGWDRYRGGLDVKSDTTGTESIYTVYQGHEICFHISTLLPHSDDNRQQVERKRHIGNDIVNIVFADCPPGEHPTFKPQMVRSQFTHIFLLVWYDEADEGYRVQVFSEENVPLFGPPLPVPALFQDLDEFREFLLVKCINGEKAAFNTPIFAQKRERTLDSLLRDVYTEHAQNESATKAMLSSSRRAFSDVLVESGRGNVKDEERKEEVARIGQALKLDTIMKGDAPTSQVNSGIKREHPWQPVCFFPDFSYEVVCGDSWDFDRLLLATDDGGAFLLSEGTLPVPVFEKSCVIKQLSIVEDHGILILRMDKGKECRVYIFYLKDFETEPTAFYTKSDCKDHKLEGTKGCNFFALNRPGGSHLRLAVAMTKKMIIMQWRHAAGVSLINQQEEVTSGFVALQELNLPETPLIVSLIDGFSPSSESRICVGYKASFDLINERTGDVVTLFQMESGKTNPVAILDLTEDDEKELLLCYHNSCHFQKLENIEQNTRAFDFQWCTVPDQIVCASPYVLAFSSEGFEIRLLVNGNLVHTTGTMPNLSLITSKTDIFFATTAPEYYHGSQTLVTAKDAPVSSSHKESTSGPPSPGLSTMSKKPVRIYRVSIASLTGTRESGGSRTLPSSPLLSRTSSGRALPAINVNESLVDREPATPSPTLLENVDLVKLRVDAVSSVSADSGFHNGPNSVSSNNSPPPSPF
ncbi:hypothetical protein RvY_08802-2 [Ramazzottius varieornatus]|uniref:GTPase-activating Rap/Ran-GAP domain-like protein 3 n=1 Tax=Ramazzottius varieornatus TaxID=947166 RepID=A0A1D1V797_RAMVA|nr:hypothetical protein RvY_08802-2 [Ramazzottius varieornatus]